MRRSIVVGIVILFILCILDFILAKWNYEYFEVSGKVKPVLLWMYGKKGKDQENLRKKFKEDYKEYIGYVDIQEYDMIKKKKEELDEMKMNPQIEYEIRFYPNGMEDKMNYMIYRGDLDEGLKEYVKQKETEQEDIVEGSGGGVAALESAAKELKN
jgi:hypothetical protein